MSRVVLSGVNMTEGGILTVIRELVNSFSDHNDLEVICLVHDKQLFENEIYSNITFIEYPSIKKSWIKRIYFEFITSYFLSKKLKPKIWFNLHDISSLNTAEYKFVYCHNPSPFYNPTKKDFAYDKKFFLFTLLYKYLYKINIKSNTAVVVQQNWISDSFKKWYGVEKTIVAKPKSAKKTTAIDFFSIGAKKADEVILFYPAFPRTFKNFEIVVQAMKMLRDSEPNKYLSTKIIFTFNRGVSRYGDYLIDCCQRLNLENIIFTGILTSEKMKEQYKSSTALIFPSLLETWGLPLTEAQVFDLPILAANLPYAHESIGNYSKVSFFDPKNAGDLMMQLSDMHQNLDHFLPASIPSPTAPQIVCDTWDDLVKVVLSLSQLNKH